MSDTAVISAIGSAASRSMNVEVIMTASSSWDSAFTTLKGDGVKIVTYAANASLYIHAKVILADYGDEQREGVRWLRELLQRLAHRKPRARARHLEHDDSVRPRDDPRERLQGRHRLLSGGAPLRKRHRLHRGPPPALASTADPRIPGERRREDVEVVVRLHRGAVCVREDHQVVPGVRVLRIELQRTQIPLARVVIARPRRSAISARSYVACTLAGLSASTCWNSRSAPAIFPAP